MNYRQCCGTVTIFYGSGSDFWKDIVPVPTFEKVMVQVPVPAPYLYHKKQIFLKKFVSFLHIKLFYKEKDYKYQQICCKMWKNKILNEGNQIHNFISSSGTVINYGSGSGSDFFTGYGSGYGSYGYGSGSTTLITGIYGIPTKLQLVISNI